MIRSIFGRSSFFILVMVVANCPAQEPAAAPAAATVASVEAKTGTKRALLLCGLSGGGERHKAFADLVTKMHGVMTAKLGFAGEDIEVLFGDEPDAADVEPIKSSARATREELEKRAQTLRAKLQPGDVLWVAVFGYTHYDGRYSWLNVPGPDIHQTDFAKLFNNLPSGQQVFLITTPASGFFVKPLSAPNRVVITATEADWETNETEFPTELINLLSSPPPTNELDVDTDGQITLFDIYVTASRNLAKSYRERELLATEHSLLDDNGDGRGTELQIDFLTPEFGGRASATKPVVRPIAAGSDGYYSKSILLPIAP